MDKVRPSYFSILMFLIFAVNGICTHTVELIIKKPSISKSDIVKTYVNQGVNGVTRLYHLNGFFDVMVTESTVVSGIAIKVIEGQRRRCGEISITGLPPIQADSLIKKIDWKKNAFFSDKELTDCTRAILDHFCNRGYPFAEVVVDNLIDSALAVYPIIRIDTKERYYFGLLSFPGGERIKAGLFDKLTGIKNGSPYSEIKVENSLQALRRSRLFSEVDSARLTVRSGLRVVDLSIPVVEGIRNEIDGLLGYDRGNDNKERISGHFRLGLKNLFGSGRNAGVYYHREDLFTEAELRYAEPWILGTAFTAEGSIHFSSETDKYSKEELTLTFAYPFGKIISIKTGIKRITETQLSIVADSLYASTSVFRTLFGFMADARDNSLISKSGWMVDISGSAGREFSSAGYFPLFRPSLRAEYLWPVKLRQLYKLRIGYDAIFTGSVKPLISDVVSVGGTESIRGYRERSFSGFATVYCRNEYHFMLNKRSSFSLFFDFGAIDRKFSDFSSVVWQGDLLMGGGMGLTIFTRSGPADIFYGVAAGESVIDGKIHLRFRNGF